MAKMINGVWTDWISRKVKVLLKIAIINSQGKILALKRSATEYTKPNCWDLPGGSLDDDDLEKWREKTGQGDENDILVKAARREVFEETRLRPEKDSFKPILAASGIRPKHDTFIVLIALQCLVDEKQKIFLNKEHSESKWLEKSEFTKLETGNDNGITKAIVKRVI